MNVQDQLTKLLRDVKQLQLQAAQPPPPIHAREAFMLVRATKHFVINQEMKFASSQKMGVYDATPLYWKNGVLEEDPFLPKLKAEEGSGFIFTMGNNIPVAADPKLDLMVVQTDQSGMFPEFQPAEESSSSCPSLSSNGGSSWVVNPNVVCVGWHWHVFEPTLDNGDPDSRPDIQCFDAE